MFCVLSNVLKDVDQMNLSGAVRPRLVELLVVSIHAWGGQ
jgi:hypothetical protein